MSIPNSSPIFIRPTPHPLKAELKTLGISVGAIAQALDRSYPYVLNMLNGCQRMTERNETKIREFIDSVKSR